jgi:hypothetical protein
MPQSVDLAARLRVPAVEHVVACVSVSAGDAVLWRQAGRDDRRVEGVERVVESKRRAALHSPGTGEHPYRGEHGQRPHLARRPLTEQSPRRTGRRVGAVEQLGVGGQVVGTCCHRSPDGPRSCIRTRRVDGPAGRQPPLAGGAPPRRRHSVRAGVQQFQHVLEQPHGRSPSSERFEEHRPAGEATQSPPPGPLIGMPPESQPGVREHSVPHRPPADASPRAACQAQLSAEVADLRARGTDNGTDAYPLCSAGDGRQSSEAARRR